MSIQGTRIARGIVGGKRLDKVFGFSDNVGTLEEDLWEGKLATPSEPNMTYLVVAEKLKLKSTSDQDKPGGTGITHTFIDGVSDNYEFVSETVEMNGTTDVETVNTYLGVNNFRTTLANSLGVTNVGILTAHSVGTSKLQSLIQIGKGASFSSHFFTPKGQVGIIKGLFFTGEKNAEYFLEFVGVFGAGTGLPISQGTSIPLIFFNTFIRLEYIEDPIFIPEQSRLRIIISSDSGPTNKLSGSYSVELAMKGIT